jgi:hypothetical protein
LARDDKSKGGANRMRPVIGGAPSHSTPKAEGIFTLAQDVFLQPMHPDAFRHSSGTCGKVTGVKFVISSGCPPMMCYEVSWDDMVDYVPLASVATGMYYFKVIAHKQQEQAAQKDSEVKEDKPDGE